jgi:acyl dehydratase
LLSIGSFLALARELSASIVFVSPQGSYRQRLHRDLVQEARRRYALEALDIQPIAYRPPVAREHGANRRVAVSALALSLAAAAAVAYRRYRRT